MTDERMSDERLEELKRKVKAHEDPPWMYFIFLAEACDEIDRARKAEAALKAENEKLREELEAYERSDITMQIPEKGHPFVPSLDSTEVCALCGEIFGCCTDAEYEG